MNARSIRRWMEDNIDEHIDLRTGEADLTGLVEDWDRTCADGAATLDEGHPAWDIAIDVAVARRLIVYS